MSKKVHIIGAGIAGLSAGCYLQMNGYDTEIFELHTVPGGLCTAWKRKDFTFDTCIHWLVGSNPNDPLYALWSELMDMKTIRFVNHEEYIRVEDGKGGAIRVFSDIDRMEKEMLGKAPEDAKVIKDFTKTARKFLKFPMPVDKAPETYGLKDGLKLAFGMLPYFPAMRKWIRISASDFAAKCKNPLLRKTFECMFVPDMSVFFLIMTMVWFHIKSAGYPVGGSLPFAKRIEKRYLGLGGKIHYGSKVKRILVENGSAVGVLLENGESWKADIVISAADGHATLFDMLEGKFVEDRIRKQYDTMKPFPSYLQVSLGVAKTFEGVPRLLYFPLDKPLLIDPETEKRYLGVSTFNYDPTMAPKGKTVMTVLLTTENHRYWVDLRKSDPKKYKAEKERIGRAVVEAIDNRYGGVASKVETTDVSTPATVIRYTNNWKGSLEGWLMTPEVGLKQLKMTLPGLSNFYMIGQWVSPGGGLPSGIMTGRNVVQVLCKKEGKKFATTKA
jgi:phytoene dehydrogenase-like protein